MEESTSNLQEIFVFIGSPSDVETERKICKKITEEINETSAHSKRILLSIAEGRYALTGKGRPQESINNEELKKSKLCTLIQEVLFYPI